MQHTAVVTSPRAPCGQHASARLMLATKRRSQWASSAFPLTTKAMGHVLFFSCFPRENSARVCAARLA